MHRAPNLLCEPSPIIGRVRNNAATPTQMISLRTGAAQFWAFSALGAPYVYPDPGDVFDGFLSNLADDNLSPAQMHGAPTIIGTPDGAKWSAAAVLNGVNQYADLADTTLLRYGGNQITFAALVYLTAKGAIRPIFSKRQAGNVEYDLWYEPTTDRWTFYITPLNGTGTAGSYSGSAAGSPALNAWTLIILSCDQAAGVATIQINAGAPTIINRSSSAVIVQTAPFYIGRSLTNYFAGRIEFVARWNRLLLPGESNALVTTWLYTLINGSPTYKAASDSPPPGYSAPTAIPATPSALTVTNITGYPTWQLEWVNEGVNAMGIEIWRSVENGPFAFADAVRAYAECTWTDTAFAGDSDRLAYKIRAVNYAGASAFTNEVLAEVPASGTFITMSGDNFQSMSGSNIALQNQDP